MPYRACAYPGGHNPSEHPFSALLRIFFPGSRAHHASARSASHPRSQLFSIWRHRFSSSIPDLPQAILPTLLKDWSLLFQHFQKNVSKRMQRFFKFPWHSHLGDLMPKQEHKTQDGASLSSSTALHGDPLYCRSRGFRFAFSAVVLRPLYQVCALVNRVIPA